MFFCKFQFCPKFKIIRQKLLCNFLFFVNNITMYYEVQKLLGLVVSVNILGPLQKLLPPLIFRNNISMLSEKKLLNDWLHFGIWQDNKNIIATFNIDILSFLRPCPGNIFSSNHNVRFLILKYGWIVPGFSQFLWK